MNIIIFIVVLLGSIVFFASACAAFTSKDLGKQFFFFKPILLVVTGVCYVISIMGFVIGMLYYHDNKDKNKPEYKLITKPVYEQIK